MRDYKEDKFLLLPRVNIYILIKKNKNFPFPISLRKQYRAGTRHKPTNRALLAPSDADVWWDSSSSACCRLPAPRHRAYARPASVILRPRVPYVGPFIRVNPPAPRDASRVSARVVLHLAPCREVGPSLARSLLVSHNLIHSLYRPRRPVNFSLLTRRSYWLQKQKDAVTLPGSPTCPSFIGPSSNICL